MSSCRGNSPRGFALRYEIMTPSRFINFDLKLRFLDNSGAFDFKTFFFLTQIKYFNPVKSDKMASEGGK